jgi:hypothetical protein
MVLTQAGHSESIIHVTNTHAGNCLDSCLALVSVYAISDDENGMQCQVHSDDFAFVVLEAMLYQQALFYYNLYINCMYETRISITNMKAVQY